MIAYYFGLFQPTFRSIIEPTRLYSNMSILSLVVEPYSYNKSISCWLHLNDGFQQFSRFNVSTHSTDSFHIIPSFIGHRLYLHLVIRWVALRNEEFHSNPLLYMNTILVVTPSFYYKKLGTVLPYPIIGFRFSYHLILSY